MIEETKICLKVRQFELIEAKYIQKEIVLSQVVGVLCGGQMRRSKVDS